MPTFLQNIPSLEFRPSRAISDTQRALPVEHEINRAALLEVAPDRETLLRGPKSIEDIRNALKIRVGSSDGYDSFSLFNYSHGATNPRSL
jgi:hypothetical protein